MQKPAENKMISGEEKFAENKVELQEFHFSEQQVTIKAKSREEALEKLKKIIIKGK